jgi:hypothetical protein
LKDYGEIVARLRGRGGKPEMPASECLKAGRTSSQSRRHHASSLFDDLSSFPIDPH